MKKLLLFAIGAMLALPSMAQEVDVTNYIQNPGFDEDVTWGINGETKEIVKNDIVYSGGRSQGWMAADSTVYAHSLGTKSRKDDIPSTSAWNGFLGRIQGWTVVSDNVQTPEWVYFGTVPYGLGAKAIPIDDASDTCISIPDKPDEDNGDDNKAALYLRAGWGGWATYSQVVSLPCAEYRLDYWVKNANFVASQNNTNVKNLCKVTCRKDVFEDNDGFNAQEWTKHSIEFTPRSEFTIQFGFQSSGGSGSNPFIWIDGIKLYKIGDVDPVKILESDLASMQGEIQEIIETATELGLEGLVTEMSDYIDEIDGVMGLDVDVMEAALKKAEADVETFKQAIAIVEELDAVMDKMLQLIQTTEYPGLDALNDAYEALNDLKLNGTAAQLLASVDQANAALRDYFLSQEGTEENPADYTFLVKSPWFIKASAEPTLQDGVWVYANEYSVGGGSSTNADLTSDGWYKSGADGGDQRLNFQQGRSCWSAWNIGFTTTIGIAQDLTDLPNGYYVVSGDLITQSGYCTNQHTFARSTAGSAISPSLTHDGYVDGGAGEWETLTTTEKVLVIDGKLTIGAEGTGNGNAAAGWFLATNFKLYYLGQPKDELAKQQANGLYTENITARPGKTVDLPIMLNNTQNIQGLQFDIQLPEGVTIEKNGRVWPVTINEDFAWGFNVSAEDKGNGHYRLVFSSQDAITDRNGKVADITLTLAEGMAPGNYEITLTDIELATENNEAIKTQTAYSTLTVKSYEPGDVNDNGEITVTDVTMVINYILGKNPANFNFDAADVTSDGTINISDVSAIINIILGK